MTAAERRAPLPERIGPVPEPRRPDAGLAWRAATPDDLDALAALERAIGEADHPTWVQTREELAEEFAHSWIGLRTDSLVGEADGRLVAWALNVLTPSHVTLVRVILMGGVHPEYRGRGVGRGLLAWQRVRGLQQLASVDSALPGWLLLGVHEPNPQASRLAEREGFSPKRWFTGLTRPLVIEPPRLALPEGLELRAFADGDAEALRAVKNEVFRDHWGSQPSTPEQWRGSLGLRSFRDDLTFLVREGDEIVGFLVTWVDDDEIVRTGRREAYIGLVGVVRRWRRRGVAPALLAHALRAYRVAGLEHAALDVDADNPSGAVALYEGLGFGVASRSTDHLLEV